MLVQIVFIKTFKMFRVCFFAIAFIALQIIRTRGQLISFPLDLPKRCSSQTCFVPACYDGRICNQIPSASCKAYCNNCIARYFVGWKHITPLCGNGPDEFV